MRHLRDEGPVWPRFAPFEAAASVDPVIPAPGRAARHAALWLADRLPPGRPGPGPRVAITAGSRAFAGLGEIFTQLVGALRTRGAAPFLVPAMGSHGGGTPEGQRGVLAHLGLTAGRVGAPVVFGDSAACGRTRAGRTVWCHPAVLAADLVVVVNRVRSHSAFDGEVQSGLVKMLAVGLGGPEGAAQAHRGGARGLEETILDLARWLAARLPLLGAAAVVEDAAGRLARLEAGGGSWAEVHRLDAACLALARRLEPRLPVADLDLLLVDWMGKDIAGPGMDPKVVGRRRVWDYPEPSQPRVRRLVVFRLTRASAGNANGVGLADFVTRRLAEAIDWPRTLKNARTTTFTQRAALPPVLESDREAVQAALETLGLPDWRAVRALRIADTRDLRRFWASEGLLGELESAASHPVRRLGPLADLPFDARGDLTDLGER